MMVEMGEERKGWLGAEKCGKGKRYVCTNVRGAMEKHIWE